MTKIYENLKRNAANDDEFKIDQLLAPTINLREIVFDDEPKGPRNLRFDHTAAELVGLTDDMIGRGFTLLDQIGKIPDKQRTFKNTI